MLSRRLHVRHRKVDGGNLWYAEILNLEYSEPGEAQSGIFQSGWWPVRNQLAIMRLQSRISHFTRRLPSYQQNIYSGAGRSVVVFPGHCSREKQRGESIHLHEVDDRFGIIERSCVGTIHLNASGVGEPRSNHACSPCRNCKATNQKQMSYRVSHISTRWACIHC